MSKQYTLREQIEAFETGNILDSRCSYFYDWFCKDSSLHRKAMRLMSKVKKFVRVMNIDTDATHVIFKNNCPFNGKLYDDFRICDNKTGDALYTVVPSCGHARTQGKCEVWSHMNDFEEPWKSASNWSQMMQQLKA